MNTFLKRRQGKPCEPFATLIVPAQAPSCDRASLTGAQRHCAAQFTLPRCCRKQKLLQELEQRKRQHLANGGNMTTFALTEEIRTASQRQGHMLQGPGTSSAMSTQNAMSDEQLVERFQAASGVLVNLLFHLPNSRRNETEADLVRSAACTYISQALPASSHVGPCWQSLSCY